MLDLVAVNIALQLADAYTTICIMRRGGGESNPLLLKLAYRLQDVTKARWAWLAAKTLLTTAVILACWWVGARDGLLLLAGWYGAVVFGNYLQYRKQDQR